MSFSNKKEQRNLTYLSFYSLKDIIQLKMNSIDY